MMPYRSKANVWNCAGTRAGGHADMRFPGFPCAYNNLRRPFTKLKEKAHVPHHQTLPDAVEGTVKVVAPGSTSLQYN